MLIKSLIFIQQNKTHTLQYYSCYKTHFFLVFFENSTIMSSRRVNCLLTSRVIIKHTNKLNESKTVTMTNLYFGMIIRYIYIVLYNILLLLLSAEQ